ncbi:pentatricopeptide repeat-containing protein [Tanacetum coccineum]
MVHGLVLKFGFGLDLFVLSSLVSMYAKFGDVGSARRVFDWMGEKERDVVTWNALLDGYVKCGEVDVAKDLFDEMGVKNVVSWTVMVDGLAKSGRVDEARRVFDEVPFRNVASWRCFGINGYMKAGDFMAKREREDCEPSARKSSSSRAHGSILGEELLQNVRLVIDELDRRGWLTLSEIAYAQSVLVRSTWAAEALLRKDTFEKKRDFICKSYVAYEIKRDLRR